MTPTIIIGAGLSGLTAANYLQERGRDFLLLEASDQVGGRVRTTSRDGFLMDHGFQVLATAYPEAKRLLDYSKLDLREFLPGALLLMPDGGQDWIGDPLRDVPSLLPTLRARTGSLRDKIRILNLRNRLKKKNLSGVFEQSETTAEQALRQEYRFSETMVERFFRPFYSGIFLEKELHTSRRMFDFVFKMFAEGAVAVPNKGMQQIPLQLAANLPQDKIRLNTRVEKVEGGKVFLDNGDSLEADNIVLATEATGLVRNYLPDTNTNYVSTTHVHYSAVKAPFEKPLIGLDTRREDLVNSIAVMSRVAPGYAPHDQELLSVSVVGKTVHSEGALDQKLREELSHWFGKSVADWQLLDVRTVEYALPTQQHVEHDARLNIGDGLYAIGDHRMNGSINAAMRSGRLLAEMLA